MKCGCRVERASQELWMLLILYEYKREKWKKTHDVVCLIGSSTEVTG